MDEINFSELLNKVGQLSNNFLKAALDVNVYGFNRFSQVFSDEEPVEESTPQETPKTPPQETLLPTPPDQEFSLFDYYSLTRRDDVLISYKGPVTETILSEISRDIRKKFSENPKIGKKLFAVFMELAQNILYYSAERAMFVDRDDSVGTLLITRFQNHHTFSCGNLVENKYIEDLVNACNTINSLDREELREYKRHTRSSPTKERSKGAGIGLIQVALTSGNPLKVEAKKVDDGYSFFALSVKITDPVSKEKAKKV